MRPRILSAHLYLIGWSTCLCLWVTLIATPLLANTYYVNSNPDGCAASGCSDANPGTSQTQAWKTLSKCNATLVPGDTCLMLAGTYSDQIRPVNSGTSDSQRIVYRVHGDGEVILDTWHWAPSESGGAGFIALGQRKYVTVSGRPSSGEQTDRLLRVLIVDKPQNDTATLYGNFTGSEGCVVENVTMDRGPGSEIGPNRGWAFADYTYSGDIETKYNILRNCEIHGRAHGTNPVHYTEDTITLGKNAHHNLIENCYIGTSQHVSLNLNSGLTHTNVFRNNFVENPEHTALSLYGLGEAAYRQDHHLVENNHLLASGETANPAVSPGNALQFSAQETIIRYNIITESGAVTPAPAASLAGFALSAGSNGRFTSDNRFYHNTVVANNTFTALGSRNFGGFLELGRNAYWNNLVYHVKRGTILIGYWRGGDDGKDRYVSNIFGNPGGEAAQPIIQAGHGVVSLAEAVANYANPTDPEFTDWSGFGNHYDAALNSNTFSSYADKDYSLKAGSPYRNAAAPLTKVATQDQGSGTNLVVEDSRFVYGECSQFPTWMGVQCDWIIVGPDPNDVSSGVKVQIQGANDEANTILLSGDITRASADFIWLWRDSDGSATIEGPAPDIGAAEYGLVDDSPDHTGPSSQIADVGDGMGDETSGSTQVGSGCSVNTPRGNMLITIMLVLLACLNMRARRI